MARTTLAVRKQSGGMFSIEDSSLSTGERFYVDSGASGASDSAGYGKDPDSPFATLDYAVGQCTANNGDIIYAMPGHVETVAAAAGLDLDVAGIKIIGLGHGNSRPQINLTATGSDIDVDAADVWLENIRITGGVDAVVAAIDVNAARFVMHNCVTEDVTGQVVAWLVTDANADEMAILDHRHKGAAAAGCTHFANLIGCDGVVFDGLHIDGNFGNAIIECTGTAVTDLEVRNVIARHRNSSDVFLKDTVTASTGMIGPNIYLRLADDAANVTEAVTGATFVLFDDIYVVNAPAEKALSINWTATVDEA